MLLIDFIDDFTVTNYYRRPHIKGSGRANRCNGSRRPPASQEVNVIPAIKGFGQWGGGIKRRGKCSYSLPNTTSQPTYLLPKVQLSTCPATINPLPYPSTLQKLSGTSAVSTIREHSDSQFGCCNSPECDSKSYGTYKGKGKAGASLQAYIKHVKEKHNMNLKDFASLPCDPRLLKPSLELWFHEWQLICPSAPLHSSNHEAIWLCTKRLAKNCCKYTCSLLVLITLE